MSPEPKPEGPEVEPCACGGAAYLDMEIEAWEIGWKHLVRCNRRKTCGWQGPTRPTQRRAASAWNRVMRAARAAGEGSE